MIATAMAAAVFSGCGNGSTDSGSLSVTDIAEGAADVLEAAKSVSSQITIDLTGDFSYNNESTEMSMVLDCGIESIMEPVAAHITENLSMSYAGESSDQSVEIYVVPEDGKTYAYTGTGDMWVRSEAEGSEANDTSDTIFREIADGNIDASLAAEKETLENGREAYVLTSPVTGNYLDQIIDFSVDNESGLFGDIDYSDMTMDTTIYIYTDTLEPALINISCSELGQAMFEQTLGFSGVDFEIGNFSIECTYNGFDTISEITVPDDVKAAAEASDASDNDTQTGDQSDSQSGTDADSSSSAETIPAEESIANAEEIIYNSAEGVLDFEPALTIDGTEYTLPFSYTDLTDDGWTVNESADGIVYANNYDLEYMNKGTTSILVYIYNPSSSDCEYSACEIIGIDIVDYNSSNIRTSLPSNIAIADSTLSDVLDAYGKPSNYFVDETMIYLGYMSDDYSNVMSLYFDSSSQLLTEIDVQKQPGAGLSA